MRALYFLLFLTIKGEALKITCGYVIRQINKQTQHGFLSDEAKSRIELIVKDNTNSDKEKAVAVHEIQLEERLKLESENVRSRVRDLVENRIKIVEDKEDFFYQPAKNGEPDYIQMGLPKTFEGSYLYYGILHHEIEHAIQDYRVAEAGAVAAEHKYSYSAQVREKMETEIDNMKGTTLLFSKGTIIAQLEIVEWTVTSKLVSVNFYSSP